jgi:isopentenyl-diphosphate delta-isomerase
VTDPDELGSDPEELVTDPGELVVLLDEQLRPVGSAPKRTVHTSDTPLHLAFSCYLRRPSGEVLLTRRALGKRTWPGVWTNSCCGHPAPGEPDRDAVLRRVRQELGIDAVDLRMRLPDFRYRAVAHDGTVENEFCPVWSAVVEGDPEPDPAEVAEWRWVGWSDLVATASRAPWALSPWAVDQIPLLAALDG